MNRGRFQAQAKNMPVKSSVWTTVDTIYKQTGHNHIDNVVGSLTRGEYEERNLAIQQAREFVDNAPAEGVFSFIKKSFRNSPQHRSVRFDVDILEGAAFVTLIEEE
ncbi:hypothetical protein CJD36_015560 [Flavipsychrobacter stenotrophus]|uniref:Uncharacterized protein n=1 Tax=Flavipsychrobacter stenotrophus TaxID=2077091 RepID=A0A2S7ST53_9BACT|nr:hypothetical protein [Flavipsychrobacter stenotrophus]PQJ10112.1 hypothetical protein CJD36_015560 [Flavipsychrobacter stenotrophus]